MFAFLLHESMNPFYQIIGSFPTALFTFLLLLCALYWFFAVLGMVDLDLLDFDMEVSAETHSGNTLQEMISGAMIRFGLTGVPTTVSLSFIALFGWLISYFSVLLVYKVLPFSLHEGFMHYLIGIPVLFATLYLASRLTALAIKPVRKLFQHAMTPHTQYIVGRTGKVRSAYVDEASGEGSFEDGGAGLILKIRANPGQRFERGDRVVLIEYLEPANAYRIISEEEFNGIPQTKTHS